MVNLARYPMLRPELHASLERGEKKIIALSAKQARVVEEGTRLIDAGEDHGYVYRLREGWVSRARTLSDGREQCILIFLPGDLFAVKSMFLRRHPDAVKVLARSVVERINHQELHDLTLRDGDVANRCTWQVMEEERRLHSWIVGLGQGSAEERLALLLIEFRGRLAFAGQKDSDSLYYDMPLTQSQLADHLGITNIHVNRVLRVFRERKIVRLHDGRVCIDNLAALTNIAGPLLDVYERATPEYVGHPHVIANKDPATG